MKIVTASKGRRGAGVDTVDCDVLVSSPAGMLTLVGEGLTGLYRCCHLVVEDGVKALEIQEEAVEKLRLDWRRRRVLQQDRLPDQVVVVGEEWNKAMQFSQRIFY